MTVRPLIILISTVAILAQFVIPFSATDASAADKSFYHPLVEVRFELLHDGSALVEETRSFRFDGKFSWAELERNTRGDYGSYEIEYLGVEDADTGERLDTETFSTGYSEKIRWHYSARNETRRFRIRYRIGGAVQRYGDAAQFYFKAVTDTHEPIEEVRIDLIPPAPSSSLFKVFVHSSARPGSLDIADDRTSAKVVQTSIRRNSFVEIRALMDPDIFPDADLLAGESHSSLLEDERRITEEWRMAEERRIEAYKAGRRQLRLSLIIGPVFLLLFAAVYFWFYFRYGKELDTGYEGIYEREIPFDLRPCTLPAILTQSGVQLPEMGKGFAATLLECARLGYLELGEREEKVLMFKHRLRVYTLTEKGKELLAGGRAAAAEVEAGLSGFEFEVLETVIRDAGDGREATSKDIEEWARRRSGSKTAYFEFIEKRAKELRSDFEREHFLLDDPDSEKARKGFILLSIVTGTVFMIVSFLITRYPLYLPFGFLAIIAGLILSIPLARRTREAALNHEKWMAFKRFISDFSAMNEAGPSLLHIWERYLVFATALGVADRFLSNLKLVAAQTGAAVPVALWFRPLAGPAGIGTGNLDGLASIESLSASISNLGNLSTALSSSSSGGGGFSGGGGGGGGGGGCGAG